MVPFVYVWVCRCKHAEYANTHLEWCVQQSISWRIIKIIAIFHAKRYKTCSTCIINTHSHTTHVAFAKSSNGSSSSSRSKERARERQKKRGMIQNGGWRGWWSVREEKAHKGCKNNRVRYVCVTHVEMPIGVNKCMSMFAQCMRNRMYLLIKLLYFWLSFVTPLQQTLPLPMYMHTLSRNPYPMIHINMIHTVTMSTKILCLPRLSFHWIILLMFACAFHFQVLNQPHR